MSSNTSAFLARLHALKRTLKILDMPVFASVAHEAANRLAVAEKTMNRYRYTTSHFVNFTKACDYYRDQGNDELTPNELGKLVSEKIEEGDIYLGKPDVPVNGKLILIDNGTRYAIEEPI